MEAFPAAFGGFRPTTPLDWRDPTLSEWRSKLWMRVMTEDPGHLRAAAKADGEQGATDDEAIDSPRGFDMAEHVHRAAAFLKAMSHEGRLLILCYLSDGEKSVTELEGLLGVRQAAVSQQLARLRIEGLVAARRDGKSIYYSIRDPKVGHTVALVHRLFCRPE
jgi:ArsR family transcriptional regulator